MFQKLSLRLRSLFRSPAVDRELDQELDNEIRYHLDMQPQDFVRRGIPEK